MDDTFINSRSLLKCCAVTLFSLAEESPSKDYQNGAVVQCKQSKGRRSHRLVVWNGVWRWADPQAAEFEERERLRKQGQGGPLWDHVRGKMRD